MAKDEHIEWLLEGAEKWNARRNNQDFTPDFEGEDLYESFRKAKKLDGEGRIPLSGMNLKQASFRRSRLSDRFYGLGADLRGADLRRANLDDAYMANSFLEDACLAGATFRRAYALGSVFRQVEMASTGFYKTNLSQCDFRGTKFDNAILEGACLLSAKLEGADLSGVVLTGAGLNLAEPWKARLYPEPQWFPGENGNLGKEKYIRRVSDLTDECERTGAGHPNTVLYFRGESRIKGRGGEAWKLRPSLMRDAKLKANERNMLVELMSRRPEDFAAAPSALALWVIAQHHRLPTRLLDITRNPLVALFNACEDRESIKATGRLHVFSVPRELVKPFSSDAVRVIANFARLPHAEQCTLLGRKDCLGERAKDSGLKDRQPLRTYGQIMDRLYDLIREEKPIFREAIDPRDFFRVFVVEPQRSFDRIRAQSGAFMVSAFHERFERDRILEWNSEIPVYGHATFRVGAKGKERILNELRLLNVTREALYPGLDEAARAVTEFYSGYL